MTEPPAALPKRDPTPAGDPDATIGLPAELEATLVLVRHGQSTWLAEGRFQGQADPPLSDLGRRQARLLGERIAARTRPPRLPVPTGRPVAIFTSPLRRTRETAELIAAALAADGPEGPQEAAEAASRSPALVADPALAEIAQGEWEGLLQAEIETRYAAVIDGWRRDPVNVQAPGGETLAAVNARVRVSLARIITALASSPADGQTGTAPADPELPPHAGHGDGPTGRRGSGRVPTRSFYDLNEAPWAIVVSHGGALQVIVMALLGLPLDRFWSFPLGPAALAVVDIRNGRAAVRAWNRTEHLAPIEAEEAEAARSPAATDQSRTGGL